MLIVAAIVKLLASAGFGTIFGGVMGLLNRKADLDVKRLEFADKASQRVHELALRDKDAVIAAQEWAGRTRVAEVEGAAATEVAGFKAMEASYQFNQPQIGTKMASFSSFIRPFIALGYFLSSTLGTFWILYYAFAIYGLKVSPDQLFEIVMFVLAWFAFMAGGTIGWYFAMRPGGQMPSLTRPAPKPA